MSDLPLPPPGYVRFKTFEEMSPAERELYTHRRGRDGGLPKCQGTEYDPFEKYHRETYGDRDE